MMLVGHCGAFSDFVFYFYFFNGPGSNTRINQKTQQVFQGHKSWLLRRF